MRNKTLGPLALSAAFLLVLAGCSSSVEGAPGPAAGSAITSTAETTAGDTTDLQTPDDDPAVIDPAAPSGAAELGSGTDLWFATYCLAAENVTQYYSSVDPTEPLADLQAQFVQTYTDIAAAAEAGAEALRSSPEPDPDQVGNAPDLAIERFTSLADIFGNGAQTIQGLAPADADELKAATQQIQQQASTTGPDIMADVPPDVLEAAKDLPECAGVL